MSANGHRGIKSATTVQSAHGVEAAPSGWQVPSVLAASWVTAEGQQTQQDCDVQYHVVCNSCVYLT